MRKNVGKGSAGFQPVLSGILPDSAPQRGFSECTRVTRRPVPTHRQDADEHGLEARAPLLSLLREAFSQVSQQLLGNRIALTQRP